MISEVFVPTAARQEGKGLSRLKPIPPDVASSGGTGHQIEQRGSNSSSVRATDRTEK